MTASEADKARYRRDQIANNAALDQMVAYYRERQRSGIEEADQARSFVLSAALADPAKLASALWMALVRLADQPAPDLSGGGS